MEENAPKPKLGIIARLSGTEQKFGGPLRLIAVVFTLFATGITLYARFKGETPILTPEVDGMIVVSDQEAALKVIRSKGGVTKVKADDFTRAYAFKPGGKGFAIGFYTKNHDRCILTKLGLQLLSDFGLSVPLTPIDVSNVVVPLGYTATVIPIQIPESTPEGNYKMDVLVTYSCGSENQSIPFPRPDIFVKP